MEGFMSQATLRPMELTGPSYIISKKPDLWLDAGRGIGTTGAREFNGSQYFSIPRQNLIGLSDFSVDCWLKPNNFTGDPIIFRQYDSNLDIGFDIRFSSITGLPRFTLSNNSTQISYTSTVALTTGVWQHLLYNIDRDGLVSYYINGVLTDTDDISSLSAYSIDPGNSIFYLGSVNPTSQFFNGYMSRFGIALGLRSPAEIAELYNQGNGKYYAEKSAGLQAAYILHCNLNEATGSAIDQTGNFVLTENSVELVKNPGFETLGAGGADTFASWTEENNGYSTVNAESGVNKDAGSYSCRLDHDSSGNVAQIYQSILTIGKTYNLSFRSKISNMITNGLKIVNPVILFTPTSGWATYSTTFVATSALLTFARGVVAISGQSIYLDTVSCKVSGIPAAVGPRETTAADSFGGYHGTLTGFTDPVTPWSKDIPDGSYTSNKFDSIGSATGIMTGFADIDLAHVDGPNGAWGPFVPDQGSGNHDAWIVSSITDTRSDDIPSTLNVRAWDEYYTEPSSSGSRWFDGSAQCFAMAASPVYGSGNLTLESWIYPTTFTAKRTIFGTGGMGDELFSNGGFETLGAGTPDVFANWTETFGLESTVTDGGADSDAGARCAKLTALNSTVSISQSILTIGRVYILTFRCKSATNSTILLTSSTPSTSYSTTTSYQTFSTTFTSNSTSLRFSTPTDTNQTYYLDNVSCKEVVPGIELSLSPTTGSLTSFIANNAVQITTSGMPPTVAYAWHHTAEVINRDRQRVDLWLDGALCASGSLSTLSGLINPSGTCRAIGAYDTERAVNPFAGAISRARIAIGSAYTNADIAETYNGGRGRSYSELSTALKAKVTHSWDLGEASGTALDSKGGNNAVVSSGTISSAASVYLPSYDGTLSGFTASPRSSTDVPTVLAGKCKSSTFSSGKYINTAVNTLSGLGARSISLWFKLAAAPSAVETLMAEAAQNLAQYGINISIAAAGGLVNAVVYKGGGATAVHPVLISAASVCDNVWHHIVYTWDGTLSTNKAILYIDGVISDSDTAIVTTQGLASTYPLNISGNNSGTLCTNGKICRPQVWAGRALTQTEVSTLYAGGDVTEGLTAEWRFNEADSITVPFTHSMDFDALTSKVDVGHPIIGSGTLPITLSSWVYADGVGETAGRIVDNGTTQLYLGSTTALTYSSNGTVLASTNGGFATGAWKHVGITRDAVGHAKFFVDGKHINRTSLTTINSGPPTSGTTNLFIGNRNATDRTFDGKIGQVQVHNGVLTQAQIRVLSVGGSVGTPLGSWKFDTPLALPALAGTRGIRFDGVNDYISLVNTDLSAAFTIMAWVNPTSFAVAQMITGGINSGIQIDTSGKISITVDGVNTVLSTNALAIGVWQHVTVTRSVTTNALTVYIGGVNDTVGSPTYVGTLGVQSIGAIYDEVII